MLQYYTRSWNRSISEAEKMLDLWHEAFPMMPMATTDDFFRAFSHKTKRYKEMCLLICCQEELVGFCALFEREDPKSVRLIGCITPKHQHRGVGKKILDKVLQFVKSEGLEQLNSIAFLSHPRAESFMKSAGFLEIERVVWSEYNVQRPLPDWTIEKYHSVLADNIKFVSGVEFESMRHDWDVCWWKHVMECLSDVPSSDPLEQIPFEKWKVYLEPPFCHRKNVIIALKGSELVGLIQLSKPTEHKSNINHTSIARSYRRRGVSTALKIKAFEWAKSNGVHTLMTQNHQHNPMLNINLRIGFEIKQTQLILNKTL